MICQNCNQAQASSILMQDGKQKFLCHKCYKELKKEEVVDLTASVSAEIENAKFCTNCGLKYEDFMASGILGCSECYTVFTTQIEDINKDQKSNEHIGKKSILFEQKSDIEDLNKMIESAFSRGDFKTASELNKKIAKIREGYGAKL